MLLTLLSACSQQPKPAKKASLAVKARSQLKPGATNLIKPLLIQETDLKALVDELNTRFKLYDSITAHQEYNADELKLLKLSAADLDSLKAHDNEDSGLHISGVISR